VRVWTQRHVDAPTEPDSDTKPPEQPARKPPRRRYPRETLVFDTETEPGPAQRIRFLVWRFYRDDPDAPPMSFLVEEGIAYADDLAERDPDGMRVLEDFARTRDTAAAPGLTTKAQERRIRFEPLSWWLQERLYGYGYRHSNRCTIVGFNLLFDFGRVCSYWAPAERFYRGGFSLGVWGEFDTDGGWADERFHPRINLKAIDPRRTLFGWGALSKDDRVRMAPFAPEARFVDLRTLTFALTDRGFNLEGACKAFGDPYEKIEVGFERITAEMARYACEDVEHTAILYRNCLTELARHEGVDLKPQELYSPATVGVRYLEAMGIRRPLEAFTNLTPKQLGWRRTASAERRASVSSEVLGWAMCAFYGGRAEARIVRTPVPVAYVDANSLYPAVNALLGTWGLMRAERVEARDVTEDVRGLLARADLADCCFTRELWREIGVTLVQIEPGGEILPARGGYNPDSEDFGIGINPFRYDGTLWYAVPDLIAAAVLSTPPKVVRAVKLTPVGVQPGLQPVRLRGGRLIDPAGDDPFVAMINERHRIRQDPTLDAEERERVERFLKITANATAYGTLARFDRRDLAKPALVDVYGPDGHTRTDPTKTPEDPGPYCFPPIAASITAAARLMLALLEHRVTQAGGTYAFCDTDSMAIISSPQARQIGCAAPGGANHVQALSWGQVREIVAEFNDLNPFDHKLVPTLWKEVGDSLTEPLWCYAISAKRYCLYRSGPDGRPVVVAALDQPEEVSDDAGGQSDEGLEDWSEHGLGLYMDPTTTDQDRPARDSQGRRLWVREAWQWILDDALDLPHPMPPWEGAYALTRFSVSKPGTAGWFKGYDEKQQSRARWIGPGGFGVIGHVHPGSAQHTRVLPTAPYESDPARWPELDWYDRHTATATNILTVADRRDAEIFAAAVMRGDPVIQTLGDVVTRYRDRTEHKSRAPTGGPAAADTTGLLGRRSVAGSPEMTDLVGKEGNQLAERLLGEAVEPGEYNNMYGARRERWRTLVLPVLRELDIKELSDRTGVARSTLYRALSSSVPHGENRARYIEIAVGHARSRLSDWDISPPHDPAPLLWRYLKEREARGEGSRRCEWCDEPLDPGARADKRYHDRCRRPANRGRSATPPRVKQ
jgi:hypothetical protein